MRTSLIPALVKVIVNNINKKNLSGRIFEFAKEYKPKALPLTELLNENDCISLGMFGENEDFFTLKGIIEAICKLLGAHTQYMRKLQLRMV